MSQDLRSAENEGNGVSRAGAENNHHKDYNGFEGMNYEQLREPYMFNIKDRNITIGERKDSKRPNES